MSSILSALPLVCVHVSSYMDKSWPPWQQFHLSVINGADVHSKTFYKHFFFLPPCHLFHYQVSNKSNGKGYTWLNFFFFLHQTYKLTHSHLSHMWAYLNASWASFVAQLLKNLSVMQETWVLPVGWEQLPTLVFWPGEFRGLYIVHGITVDLT